MGVALFIVPERDIEGIDTFVDGKALAHCRPAGAKRRFGRVDHLATLAEWAGVRPLGEFFSIDPAEAEAWLAEAGVEPPPGGVSATEWFSAADGLSTVRGLMTYLRAHPDSAADVDRLLGDLEQFEEVLGHLEAAGIRWHLAVDV